MITKKLSIDYYESEKGIKMTNLITELANSNEAATLEKLIIGAWEIMYDIDSSQIIDILSKSSQKFTSLKSLFIGDMTSEENEVSWINHCDFSPLFVAYPNLEELIIKGSNSLRLKNLNLNNLKKLQIICGGLSKNTISDIINSKLPNLEHLELYFGVSDYGFNSDINQIRLLLNTNIFPKLKYLGLKNSSIQDQIVIETLKSDIINQLNTLDFSLGSLSDKGGRAIIESDIISKISFIDLHYNYMSDSLIQEFSKYPNVDVSDPQTEDCDYEPIDDSADEDEPDCNNCNSKYCRYPSVTE